MPRPHPTPEEAATKIQATFRGYNTRKHIQEEKEVGTNIIKSSSSSRPNLILSATKNQVTSQTFPTSKDLTQVQECPDIRINDLEGLTPALADLRLGQTKSNLQAIQNEEERRNQAAIHIQAAFRGYRVRSHLTLGERSGASSPSYSPQLSEDEAATKIQAAFRGYRVRKNMRAQTAPIPHYEGQKYDEAARKIQANFRGYRVRKEVESLKHQTQEAES